MQRGVEGGILNSAECGRTDGPMEQSGRTSIQIQNDETLLEQADRLTEARIGCRQG